MTDGDAGSAMLDCEVDKLGLVRLARGELGWDGGWCVLNDCFVDVDGGVDGLFILLRLW